jgi:hypothetical protein
MLSITEPLNFHEDRTTYYWVSTFAGIEDVRLKLQQAEQTKRERDSWAVCLYRRELARCISLRKEMGPDEYDKFEGRDFKLEAPRQIRFEVGEYPVLPRFARHFNLRAFLRK